MIIDRETAIARDHLSGALRDAINGLSILLDTKLIAVLKKVTKQNDKQRDNRMSELFVDVQIALEKEEENEMESEIMCFISSLEGDA